MQDTTMPFGRETSIDTVEPILIRPGQKIAGADALNCCIDEHSPRRLDRRLLAERLRLQAWHWQARPMDIFRQHQVRLRPAKVAGLKVSRPDLCRRNCGNTVAQ
jgi:hypothetical protein